MRLVIFILGGFIINAQTIRINEVVSSNSVYFDQDGDSPDWFELHNYGSQTVSLENWSISDDLDNLEKWTFPSLIIAPNDYLLVWASGKDLSIDSYARTLISQGDLFKYDIPNSEPIANWKDLNNNVSSWAEGPTGIGYADGDDATLIPSGTLSVYLKRNFNITNIDDILSLILDIDYDDAFVAYINGVEVARANITGVPPPSDTGNIYTDHEAQMYNGGLPDRFVLSNFDSILQEGENVLAIQAHNISSTSSDLTIIPFLSAN